jgi:GDPmannose 4,6-dehydratase
MIKKNIKIYFSGTGQIFDYKEKNISEKSKIFPRNIYSYSKNIALNLVARYRNLYGLKVCTGITFNHESHLRSKEFVTMKIIKDAISVKNNKKNKITLSNVDSYCDWGWAPEYVEAMWKMLQRREPKDYVIATSRQFTVKQFVNLVAVKLKMNIIWKGHGLREVGLWNNRVIIKIDKKYFRPTEVNSLRGDFSLARKELKWKPKYTISNLVNEMVEQELRLIHD